MGGTGLSEVPLKNLNLTWGWKALTARNGLPLQAVKRAVPRHGLADAGHVLHGERKLRIEDHKGRWVRKQVLPMSPD
jgi:hypothetical protein